MDPLTEQPTPIAGPVTALEGLPGRPTKLPTLAGYLALLRGGWLVVLLAVVAGAAIGLYADTQAARLFEANVSVQLPALASFVQLDPEASRARPATIDTSAQLVFSTPVVDKVAVATGQSPSAVRAGLSVSAYPLSNVLIIGYQAPTPDAALSGAGVAARATLEQRRAVLAGTQLRSVRALYAKLQNLRTRAQSIAPRFPQLSRRVNLAVQHIRNAQSALTHPETPRIETPEAPQRVGVSRALYPTTGVVSGFVAAVTWLWWRRRSASRSAASR